MPSERTGVKMKELTHGHGSVKLSTVTSALKLVHHPASGRIYFKFAERKDGKFDWAIADDKAFSVAVETKVLNSMDDVVHEIGTIGE